MNPAYVRILAEEGILRLQAAAKEGLVKQHTAERAIERLEKALDD